MAWIDKTAGCSAASTSSTRRSGVALVAVPIAVRHLPAVPHADDRGLRRSMRVPITQEERRVAGGNRLTAKLKVHGSGLRPMLQASIDDVQSLGFVFENPNSADVLVGVVPPGTHDFILLDGVQEVARLRNAVTIEATAPRALPAWGR